jgi:DedD protein
MKLVMDERLKHRLVGLLVVLSIAAIFVPAIIKKSNQRFEGNRLNVVSIRLPEKPPMPKVIVPTEETVFKRVKVAHVNIDTAKQPVEALATISRAEKLSQPKALNNRPVLALAEEAPQKTSQLPSVQELKPIQNAQNTQNAQTPQLHESKLLAVQMQKAEKPLLKAKNQKPVYKPDNKSTLAKVATNSPQAKAISASAKKSAYAIQLGIFSEKRNALALLNKLKKNGFDARFIESSKKNAKTYKILVGQVGREAAFQLQKQLVAATQIKGFIVPITQVG